MSIIKSQLKKSDAEGQRSADTAWEFDETFGAEGVRREASNRTAYETKFKREQVLQLPKTHYHDAVAICCDDGEVVKLNDTVYFKKHVSKGDYKQTKGKRSEVRIPTGKLFGLRKFDLINTTKGTGFVKGKRTSGFFCISNICGDVLSASVNIKKNCVRLQARTTTLTERKAISRAVLSTEGGSLPRTRLERRGFHRLFSMTKDDLLRKIEAESLSVRFVLHKLVEEAIRNCEKIYSVFWQDKGKAESCYYIVTNKRFFKF